MRLFKTLLHNCLHDLRKNLKQLIAIIFIIGIAITLFTGLSANSIEFEKRVNAVYSKENGNLADIWVTLNVNFNEETVNDKENVKKFTREDIYRFYKKYYTPKNALITLKMQIY